MNIGHQIEGNLANILNDFSIDAIIAVDAQWTVIAWNKMAEIIYGKSKAAALGKPLTDALPDLPADAETLIAIKRAFGGVKCFVPATKLYAHRHQVENHYIPLTNESGVTGVMNIAHDVAHRIKAEERLQALNSQLEKQNRQLEQTSAELANFTFISSRNIKQPIRQIYTAIEHLIKSEAGRLTDSGKASFRRIQSSLNNMNLLLDDMLQLAQISILEKPETPVDLKDLLAEVITSLHKKITEQNAVIVLEDLCVIQAHREQLQVLFYHLLNHVMRFKKSNSPQIRITCRKEWVNQVPQFVQSEKEYYRVTLTHNGPGFEEADMEKMFDMFEEKHAGMDKSSVKGLAIARKIMHAYEGFIQAESNPAGGFSFHCFFPAYN